MFSSWGCDLIIIFIRSKQTVFASIKLHTQIPYNNLSLLLWYGTYLKFFFFLQ